MFLLFHTYRQCGHSKSDDCSYRTKEEEKTWLKKDPLSILESRLSDKQKIASIKEKVDKRIESAYQKAKQAKFPVLDR